MNKFYFETWLSNENQMNRIFKGKVYDKYRITPQDKIELLDQVEGQLSPENLTCDGELRGDRLEIKINLLNGVKAHLESL
jgi:hypothetical protein